MALRELRLFGSFDRLDDAVAGLPRSAPGAPVETAVQEIFGRMFQRIEADQPPALRPLVGAMLSALSLSRRGLSEDGLGRFLIWRHPAISPAEVEATIQVVLRQMRPYLSRRQAPEGCFWASSTVPWPKPSTGSIWPGRGFGRRDGPG